MFFTLPSLMAWATVMFGLKVPCCTRLPGKGKHGTGCVLSSAILANVALGKDVPTACEIAKQYMNEYLQSGEGRLGFLV